MNLQELRDVQDRERATDSIQELPDDFYEEVSAYIRERKAERAAAAEGAEDPFSVPEVSRLTDEIETAEQVATAVYERRMGKLLTQASLAAADVGPSVDGLTAEEQDLFDDLVERIESNKERVLSVLTDSAPPEALAVGEVEWSGGESPTDDPPDGQATVGAEQPGGADGGAVDAADLMGAGDGTADGDGPGAGDDRDLPDGAEPDGHPPDEPLRDGTAGDRSAGDAVAADAPGETDGPADGPDAGAPDAAGAGGAAGGERVTVQVTDDVGEVFGVDERVYDLAADDVVTLPAENATALVDRGAAERLDGPDGPDDPDGDSTEGDTAGESTERDETDATRAGDSSAG